MATYIHENGASSPTRSSKVPISSAVKSKRPFAELVAVGQVVSDSFGDLRQIQAAPEVDDASDNCHAGAARCS